MSAGPKPPNEKLRGARLKIPSPNRPGHPMSCAEHATAANRLLHDRNILDQDVDATYLAKLEAGEYHWVRNPHRRWAIRTALGVENDADIGFYRHRTGKKEPDPSVVDPKTPTSETSIASARSPMLSESGCIEPSDGSPSHVSFNASKVLGVFEALDESGCVIREARSFGQGASTPVERMANFVVNAPTPRTVGWGDVEHIRYMTRAFALSENIYGGGFSVEAAAAQLRYAARLIDARAEDDVRCAIHEAVGNLSGVVGFSAFDVADYETAQSCFDFELWCANQAGSWPLRASALSDMARLSIYLGSHDHALTSIEFAQVRSERLSSTTNAMLCAMRARLLALQGRHEEALSEISHGDEYFAARDADLDPPWMSYYDEAEHEGSMGRALIPVALQERNLEIVEPRLSRAIELHDGDHPRSRAFSRIRLASVAMIIGDPREAAATGHIAVAESSALKSARVRTELERLANLSRHHGRISDVEALYNSIADTGKEAGVN